jgi:site-specific DNA-methyltransferase (adenine-specific)/modification methylase
MSAPTTSEFTQDAARAHGSSIQRLVGRHCVVTLYNADCLELPWMDADALISDPPYGIAYCHGARKGGVKMGTDGEAIIGDDKPFDPRPWLGYPVVVLWGANHYANRLPNSSRWLIWDKREGIPANDQADGETAWTNQNGVLRLKSRYWNGAQAKEKDEPRIHSNQKPVSLMAWCMETVGVTEGAHVWLRAIAQQYETRNHH